MADLNGIPALSIRQPWAWAILHAGKRIENRDWRNCRYRGPVLIHASATTGRAFDEAALSLRGVLLDQDREREWEQFVADHLSLTRRGEPRYRSVTLPLGGIVGRARIVDVIAGPNDFERWVDEGVASERDAQRAWWVGGFGLVLDDVEPLPFRPCKGALGLFKPVFGGEELAR